MKTVFKLIYLIFITASLSACVTRKITKENSVNVGAEKIELNAEWNGENYAKDGTITFWLDDLGNKSMMGHMGIFNTYYDDPDSLILRVDGVPHPFTAQNENNYAKGNGARYTRVPKDLVVKMANAKDVEVKFRGNKGAVRYDTKFTKKNYVKFQEFVQKYVDPSQEVDRSPWIMRKLGLSDDE